MEFLNQIMQSIALQVIGVLGIFFALGFGLSKIQEAIHKKYQRSIGWKGILLTAWMGTPIHELGHIFFAKIFGHKIDSFSLFAPNPRTGGLGYVNHSYLGRGLWPRLGNFFIGAAPMIFGSGFLFLMLYFLLPNGREIVSWLQPGELGLANFFSNIGQFLINLFSLENINSWNFWLFLYLSFCVASHLAPSSADLKNMWRGFFWLVLLLLVVNAIFLLFGTDITVFILSVGQYLATLTLLFVYSILLSLLHLLFIQIIFLPFRK